MVEESAARVDRLHRRQRHAAGREPGHTTAVLPKEGTEDR
jgi:hypothetical protein